MRLTATKARMIREEVRNLDPNAEVLMKLGQSRQFLEQALTELVQARRHLDYSAE